MSLAPQGFRWGFRTGASEPRRFGVDLQRTRELDPVALGERRLRRGAAAEYRDTHGRRIEPVLRDNPGACERIGDRRSGGKLDLDDVLYGRRRPNDRYLHGALAYSASAR